MVGCDGRLPESHAGFRLGPRKALAVSLERATSRSVKGLQICLRAVG